MDWDDTPTQAAFRAEVRQLILDRLPGFYVRLSEEGVEEGYEGGWIADRKSDHAERREAAAAPRVTTV